jgi:hypothetical protein
MQILKFCTVASIRYLGNFEGVWFWVGADAECFPLLANPINNLCSHSSMWCGCISCSEKLIIVVWRETESYGMHIYTNLLTSMLVKIAVIDEILQRMNNLWTVVARAPNKPCSMMSEQNTLTLEAINFFGWSMYDGDDGIIAMTTWLEIVNAITKFCDQNKIGIVGRWCILW